MPEDDRKICALCGREVEELTRHHLIPRKRHKLCRKRGLDRRDLERTVPLCLPCHDHIHTHFTEAELAERYNTLAALLEREEVRDFVAWVRKQPSTRVRLSRRRRSG